jgi:hypothetical protein
MLPELRAFRQKTCVRCGGAFELTGDNFTRGRWRERRYCTEACRNAEKQKRNRARNRKGSTGNMGGMQHD